jgi:hypothetical protein
VGAGGSDADFVEVEKAGFHRIVYGKTRDAGLV